jgi:hypothetical protein
LTSTPFSGAPVVVFGVFWAALASAKNNITATSEIRIRLFLLDMSHPSKVINPVKRTDAETNRHVAMQGTDA